MTHERRRPDDELLRPELHFTAAAMWLNDPNGLVFYDGEYHLFFQANPFGSDWGNMSWGHAVSTDLIRWRALDIALRPYPGRSEATTTIFSGSAVVDRTSGHAGELVAFFTAHEEGGAGPKRESVARATSQDRGRTWSLDERNPLIDPGLEDFRDPKVFWFEPEQVWVMVIAQSVVRSIDIYRSLDGLVWTPVSRFHDPTAAEGIWECPDLFPVSVPGTDDQRWVLLVSCAHPAGLPHNGMVYWVGHFDGTKFVPDRTDPEPVEYGKDFMAGVTFNGLPRNADPIIIGWASNWAYARAAPTPGWRGAMSLPRELTLELVGERYRLCQAPVRSLESYLAAPRPAEPGERFLAADLRVERRAGDGPWVLRLVSGPNEWLEVGIDPAAGRMWIDRRHTGRSTFHDSYPSYDVAELLAADLELIDVRVIVDHCVVEVFTCKGRSVMTSVFYPTDSWTIDLHLSEAHPSVRRVNRLA